jgi:hypothetical protein
VARATDELIETVESRWRREIGLAAYDAMMSALRQLGHATMSPAQQPDSPP